MTPQPPLRALARKLRSHAIRSAARITEDAPGLRRLLRFHPDAAWPSEDRVEILHKSAHVFAWTRPEFEAQRSDVFENNIDRCSTSIWPHDGSAQRLVALVRDVEVCGSAGVAVDPATGRVVNPDAWDAGDTRARGPSPAGILRRSVSADPTLIVPRIARYDDLMSQGIAPLLFALSQHPAATGRPINVVTVRRPPPLVRAFLECLREAGYGVSHIPIGCGETLRIPLYLHASSHTRNRENLFAFPEAMAMARRKVEALPRDAGAAAAPRIYMRARYASAPPEPAAGLFAEKLASLGCMTLDAGWRDPVAQVRALRDARIVVAHSGDGLSNILWTKPGALLVDIMPTDARCSAGLHFAAAAGAAYRPVFWTGARANAPLRQSVEAAIQEIDGLIRAV